MFGRKKEICCICNRNEGAKKIMEGMICNDCISKCGRFLAPISWKSISSERVNQAILANQINARNLDLFNATNHVENYIELDEINHLWKAPCFSKALVFPYDDIISYELLQDGETITKGSLGKAMVGGALFGGVGAIVGSNMGSKTKQIVNEYKIKIVTKNICFPEVYINFLTTGAVKSNSILFSSYKTLAQRILSLLSIITNNQSETISQNNTNNIADEIREYKRLLDECIITQEEFDAKKAQLLNLDNTKQ